MPKNIVVCCDGTNNQFGTVNTNVVRVFQSVVRDTPNQVAMYNPGVGTFAAHFWGFFVGNRVGKFLGETFGYGVKKNMEDCYRFLMNVYEEGDKVYVFGFSRGAFTARSLASMLDKCGLLYKHHENMVSSVSEQYFKRTNESEVMAFKATFCRPCVPYFVGVWDTVGSLGLILATHRFANNKLSPRVKYAYHALSIDEKRRNFQPTLWDESALAPEQVVEQLWFAGVHSDDGGGYPAHSLADIPLRWMLENAKATGLLLKSGALDMIHGNPLGEIHNSYTFWWHLLGSKQRDIPSNANIAPSVTERVAQDPSYRPPNLPSST